MYIHIINTLLNLREVYLNHIINYLPIHKLMEFKETLKLFLDKYNNI